MIHILLGLQYFGVLIVFACMIVLVKTKGNYMNQVILFFSLFCNLFNLLGTILEMQSRSLDAAITGVKIAYYGKTLVLTFMLLFVYQYLKLKKPKIFFSFLFLVHFAIIIIVWTCDYHNLYYKTIDFVETGLFPHLVTTAGPFYYVYFILLFAEMIFMFVICFRKLIESNNRNERANICCLMLMPIIICSSFLVFKMNVTKGFDCTTLAILLCTALLIYCIQKYELIDYVAKAKDEIIDELSEGIIVIDRDNNVVYYNKRFRSIYPGVDLLNNVSFVKEKKEKAQKGSVWVGERYYTIRTKELMLNDEVQSTIYSLSDSTESYMMTYIDGLTNVGNRRALNKALDEYSVEENSFLVIMDIDNFKTINDTLGHKVGDDSLKSFANCLVENFSRNAVYRYGGDEFVMLVTMEPDELEKRLANVNETLSAETNEVPFHVSGGYVELVKGIELEILMKKADDALYIVKKSGKGRFARG